MSETFLLKGEYMNTRINLLEGKILPALSSLALPIMATSFIQMAYNLIDMIWIGRIGSGGGGIGAAESGSADQRWGALQSPGRIGRHYPGG